MVRVLLVCGSGASSGFMAVNMRKALSKMSVDMTVKARSDSELENYIDEIDVVMIGPHLKYMVEEAEETVRGTNIKVILMKPDYYATLDGKKAIDHLVSELGGVQDE